MPYFKLSPEVSSSTQLNDTSVSVSCTCRSGLLHHLRLWPDYTSMACPVLQAVSLTALSTPAVQRYIRYLISPHVLHVQNAGPVRDFFRFKTCQLKFCPGGLHNGMRKCCSAVDCATSHGGLRLITYDTRQLTGDI
jgi:hypothetical protein